MKRQSEELFFKYIAKPTQKTNKNVLNINLPSDYSPIAGDIIEIFISDNQNVGYITYSAKLVIYKPVNTDILYDIAAISGKLAHTDSTFEELDSAYLTIDNGVKFVTLVAPSGQEIFFDASAKYIVNLIVHRSKASIDLYEL